jgi:crotonobetainyl-CoA:carnitine CoA-transferase CaiB-like acyl-CoA transferase
MMQNVLAGIKVVDVTMFAFMPMVGGVLSHWGADVIKVESPKSPDPMRLLSGGTLEPGGSYQSFKNYNLGKRAIAIDLSTAEGQAVLYKLVESADVFLTSYLPATRRKLKVDVDDIRAHNPDIVYVKGSGQGPLGPESERRAYDAAAWWARGSLASTAMANAGTEWPIGMVGHGDTITGTVLAGGVCAALLERERTGVARVVDGSLMGTALWYNHQPIIAAGLGTKWGGGPMVRENHPPALNTYKTKDGRFITLCFVNDPDGDWVDLCAHLGHPELATDPRFSTTSARMANRAVAVGLLDEIFAQKTLEEWKEVLRTAHGVWAPIQTPAEMHDDPQVKANGFIRTVEYPPGPIHKPVPPVLFDQEAGDIGRAPDFCEHTDEVLAEVGYTPEDVARLRADGAIA